MPYVRKPFNEEKFWSRINKKGPDGINKKGPDECWLWNSGCGGNGYPMVRMNGKAHYSYRVSWFLMVGEWPLLQLCHNCPSGDNPLCCNPRHLFLGTQADNLKDMNRKGRHGSVGRKDWSCWMRGESNNHCKFTESQICDIREEYSSGTTSKAALARKYGVWPSTIDRIVTGKTWKHGGVPSPV